MICEDTIKYMKDGATLINCGRGELVNSRDIAAALESGKLDGYGADVLDQEPPAEDHPLLGVKNCIITPHVGSRTFESVQRQAFMATQNLVNLLKEKKHWRKSTTSSRLQPLSNLLLNAHFYVREILHRPS